MKNKEKIIVKDNISVVRNESNFDRAIDMARKQATNLWDLEGKKIVNGFKFERSTDRVEIEFMKCIQTISMGGDQHLYKFEVRWIRQLGED